MARITAYLRQKVGALFPPPCYLDNVSHPETLDVDFSGKAIRNRDD